MIKHPLEELKGAIQFNDALEFFTTWRDKANEYFPLTTAIDALRYARQEAAEASSDAMKLTRKHKRRTQDTDLEGELADTVAMILQYFYVKSKTNSTQSSVSDVEWYDKLNSVLTSAFNEFVLGNVPAAEGWLHMALQIVISRGYHIPTLAEKFAMKIDKRFKPEKQDA